MTHWKLQLLTTMIIAILIPLKSTCQTIIKHQSEEQIRIPLDISTQRPILELMIKGKGPYRFIFDTGSSGNVIDEGLADKFGFELIGEDPLRTPGSENKLMSKRLLVPAVTFVGTNISVDTEMNTIALRKMLPVDGILSPNFFSEYLIAIDYPQSELVLTKAELDKSENGVIPFIQNPRVINLEVSVGKNKAEAHLDSGNPGGFSIPYTLRDSLKFLQEPYEAGNIRTPVATFKKWDGQLDGNIMVGGVKFENPQVSLVENFQFVNLGYQVFKDMRISIDKKNNLIKFEKSNSNQVISKTIAKESQKLQSEESEFSGWYGNHERKIFKDKGELFLQRGSNPRLKLVKTGKDNFKMIFHIPVDNEIPHVRFERDKNNKINGFTFIFKNGREDFVIKN